MKTQRTERRATDNMRLASCGVQCLNSSSVFQLGFSAGLTVLCSEIPHERQAQKRYKQIKFSYPRSSANSNHLHFVKFLLVFLQVSIRLAQQTFWYK